MKVNRKWCCWGVKRAVLGKGRRPQPRVRLPGALSLARLVPSRVLAQTEQRRQHDEHMSKDGRRDA